MNIKRVLVAAMLSAAPLVAGAADYAPEEFDFSELSTPQAVAYGTVESVREVPVEDTSRFAGFFEHAIRPEFADELVVLLDDGRTITVMQNGLNRFGPGQRVRVIPQPLGARVEHS
jgi:outer membrane lipoprotein SlyB